MKDIFNTVNNKLSILIAEDDADDRFMLKEAFKDSGIVNPVLFVENGDELMKMLCREGEIPDTAPGLILLDLNMPKKDGREALKEIKSDERFKHIPIIIFTTSSSENDLINSYLAGANSFILKPNSYERLIEVVKSIYDFWFKTVKMPG